MIVMPMCCMLFVVISSVYIVVFFFSSRRRHTRCALVTGVQTCALPISAWASDAHVAPMTDYAKSTVKQWISDATVIEAVKAQNAKHAGLSQTDIDNMDKDWRAQTDASSMPMIDAVEIGRAHV